LSHPGPLRAAPLAVALAVCSTAGSAYAVEPAPVRDASAVEVVSINAWGIFVAPQRATRLAAIDAWLQEQAADVVGLQELWSGVIPVAAPTWQHDPAGGDDGLALSGRAASKGVSSRPFQRATGFDALKRKGVLRGEAVLADGERVWVFVTHLQAGVGARFADVRADQVATLLDWVAESEGPAILLGDFNLAPGEEATERALAEAGARDVLAEFGALGGTYPGDGHRYDRIFVVDGPAHRWEVEDAAVVVYDDDPMTAAPARLSDHYPIRARLRLGRSLSPEAR
jgi:endonuclease/exonuclease/phosphatase family metal-dependent hydrolase